MNSKAIDFLSRWDYVPLFPIPGMLSWVAGNFVLFQGGTEMYGGMGYGEWSNSSGSRLTSIPFGCIKLYLVYTLIIPGGKFGPLYLGKATAAERAPLPIKSCQVHAGSFNVSVIHRTPTWTSGSLTCVHDHPYACSYTRRLGTPTTSQHNIFYSEKLTDFSCAPDIVRTSGLRISSPTLYQLSHPVTPFVISLLLACSSSNLLNVAACVNTLMGFSFPIFKTLYPCDSFHSCVRCSLHGSCHQYDGLILDSTYLVSVWFSSCGTYCHAIHQNWSNFLHVAPSAPPGWSVHHCVKAFSWGPAVVLL